MAACPPRQLVIRSATTDDLPGVAALLNEAGAWMRSQGITDQWPLRFPISDLQGRVAHDELYIASDGATLVGTFALDHHADPEFWHDDPDGIQAGYLHRLTVARSHAGHDLGSQLIDHASDIVAGRGRLWLRLDCAKHNTQLHDYYRSLAFRHVRTIDIPHRRSGALFQRGATRTRQTPRPAL